MVRIGQSRATPIAVWVALGQQSRYLRPHMRGLSSASMIRRAPFVTFQFLVVTAVAGCSDDGGGGGDGRSIFNRADGGATVTNSREVDAEDSCELVCKVADDCDKNFDKQTCSHRCGNQASSIVKLNPSVQSELYECFEDSTCKVVNAESF